MSAFLDAIMENPEAVADFTYDHAYKLSNAQLDHFHRHWLQKRFEALRPKVPALDKLATAQSVDKISSIDDAAPLLFAHTVYKSYPMSYLERGRFDALTKWLTKLTTSDLSAVDATDVETIDDWIDLVEAKSDVVLIHTSGTTGKLSFLPRTKGQLRNMAALVSNICRDWQGPHSHADMLDEHRPVINPGYRHGAGHAQRMGRAQVELFAGGDDNALFLYPNQRMSADLLSLAGRLRTAEARGEQGSLEIPQALLKRREELIEQEKQRPAAMKKFLDTAVERFGGKDIYIGGIYSLIYDWAEEGIRNGKLGVFGADSFLAMGGGMKGRTFPDNWRTVIADFLGFSNLFDTYAMTECSGLAMLCEEGKYHFSPLTIPYLLDPKTGELLPRREGTFGRFGFFDLRPDNFWAGMVSGDAVTLGGVDKPCKCGRNGYYIEQNARRFSELEGGDDKVLCSGAPEAHDRAAEFLADL